MNYQEQLNRLTCQYNDAIHALESSYNMENTGLGWNLSDSFLTRQYSHRYDQLAHEYAQRKLQLFQAFEQSNPEWARWRRIWGRIFVLGIILILGSCVYMLPGEDSSATLNNMTADPSSSTLSGSAEARYWTADEIPIPFLQDSTQYVSNPDHVLAQQTVDHMNVTLKRLDNELGIETVVIIVNHIANDDPFRLAQDVGNRYGVGRGDRGLMIVCGYEDHSINISPGRALEADLTDAECHRLEQRYVIPAMRAEKPDSAMLYLTEAVYATLQQKDMPVMSRLTSAEDEIDDQIAIALAVTTLLLMLWGAFFLHLNRKYQWVALVGTVALLTNPFFVEEHSHFGGGGFGGGSFGGGGGGFSGGSFGGGSFGGGGATSRW